jgi:triosephosphate isomerase
MRIPLIAGNWKMNTTLTEAVTLVNAMKPRLEAVQKVEKLVCPPFISLAAAADVLKGTTIKLGAQNCHFMEKGAYTGEVSPTMLAGVCEYVILGHSERRQYFGDTNEVVNKKIKAALAAGLKPILCVGERLEENEAGKTGEVVTGQLTGSLDGIDYDTRLVIAYEPVWAIGTGKAATAEQANDTIGICRSVCAGLYGKAAESIRILYGGSVTAANATELMRKPEIDGALIGGASLKPDEFVSIAQQTSDLL